MGYQINFYLAPSDVEDLECKIRAIGDLNIIHSRSMSPTPRMIESFNFQENGDQWIYLYLVKPEFLGDVKMRHIPEQGYWVVDTLTSPVVELQVSYYDAYTISRGRLYFDKEYYDANGKLVVKPSPFVDWAQKILSATRTVLVKLKTSYAGACALELEKSGAVSFLD